MAAKATQQVGRIAALQKLGQSLWLDNIRRQFITSGELARLRDEGVTGVTSNPTIFEKAVSGSSGYEQALARLAGAGRTAQEILWDLMVEDIQGAADVFRPVFDRTGGGDGYVSIEVSPDVASDTTRTIAMAEDLRRRCARPNVMVKIPATSEGIPAIRDQIAKGHNINVTLIFSVDRYAEVVEAFLSGLEELQRRGGDVSRVASVASFFVSRMDTKVDGRLRTMIAAAADADERKALQELLGKAGIANSKIAYQRFKELHSGPRWEALSRAGARVQRCLWASTSAKDPTYPDTMYVEELIGPDTINTVPNHTLAAFADHGKVCRSLDDDVAGARRHLGKLAEHDIDLLEITRELEVEGVGGFEKSYESLTEVLGQAVQRIGAGKPLKKADRGER
jgi:transaldolase